MRFKIVLWLNCHNNQYCQNPFHYTLSVITPPPTLQSNISANSSSVTSDSSLDSSTTSFLPHGPRFLDFLSLFCVQSCINFSAPLTESSISGVIIRCFPSMACLLLLKTLSLHPIDSFKCSFSQRSILFSEWVCS